MKSKSNPFLFHALAASAVFLAMGSAHAATYDWTGGSTTNDNFTDPTNWGGSWDQWSDYNFGGTPTRTSMTIDNERGIGSIHLQSGLATDFVIESNLNPIIMGTDQSSSSALITIAADSSNLTINGRYIASSAVTWDVGASRTLTLNGPLNDWYASASLVKIGEGTAVLTQMSNYTGGTTVNGGTLSLADGDWMTGNYSNTPGGATGPITVGSGGTLSTSAGVTKILSGLTLNGGTISSRGINSATNGNLMLASNITADNSATSLITSEIRLDQYSRSIDVNNGGTLTISGSIGYYWYWDTNIGINKTGEGTLKLSGTNSYGGQTNITGGTLQIGDGGTTGSLATSSTIINNGNLTINRSDAVTQGTDFSGSAITGSGSLTQAGTGTTTLTAANTYTGGTMINAGTVIAGGGGVANSTVTIATGATLATTSASSAGLAAFYYNNTHDQANIASLPAMLAHFGTNSPAPSLVNTTASMNFGDGGTGFPAPYSSGAENFEAFYSGKVNITTAGTYTFNTSSDDGSMLYIDGQVVVTNNTDQGFPGSTETGSITLTAGMHDIVIAYNQGGGGYGLNAQISGADNTDMVDINTSNTSITPDLVVGSLAGEGSVSLTTGNLITGINNSSTNFSGVISGIGSSLTKFGSGVQTLSGTNTYTGTTQIIAGALQLGNGGTTGSLATSSTIVNNGNLTINRSNAVTQGTDFSSSAITGSGSLTQAGTGTTTLTAANTYTGSTTVTAGTLNLGDGAQNTGLADTADVSVATGATLNLNYPADKTDTVNTLFLAGAQVTSTGTWGSPTSGAEHTSALITGTGKLNVTAAASADPFASWINATWPTLSDKTATGDPDNDGISNLLEYILKDGNPAVSSSDILPKLTVTATDFKFTYFRRVAATGTTQTFEYSTTLSAGSWTQVLVSNGGMVSIADPVDGNEQVTITIPKGTYTKLFGRLQVTQP